MYETYQILQEKMISRFSGLLTEAEILLGLLRNFSRARQQGWASRQIFWKVSTTVILQSKFNIEQTFENLYLPSTAAGLGLGIEATNLTLSCRGMSWTAGGL